MGYEEMNNQSCSMSIPKRSEDLEANQLKGDLTSLIPKRSEELEAKPKVLSSLIPKRSEVLSGYVELLNLMGDDGSIGFSL